MDSLAETELNRTLGLSLLFLIFKSQNANFVIWFFAEFNKYN